MNNVEGYFSWVINATVAGVPSVLRRWFSNFNGTTSYAQLNNDILLTGDFEIEFDLNSLKSQHKFD